MGIKENIENLRFRIKNSALKAGRNPGEIKLVAVTKYVEAEQIEEAISAGIKITAENRLQEALEKFEKIKPEILNKVEKHFIGTLQRNKIKAIVKNFDAIQSVDSVKIAQEIDEECRKINRTIPIFVEVNIGKEETKHGIMPEETLDFCNKIMKFTNIKLVGLMCIAPYSENAEDSREYFRQMKEIQKKVGVKHLSMGMSNDFEIAIEEGSNMVRIGRGIFGEDK